jgi:2-polyprenyl-3-methyl-5-hydroxy-6-metoxy-1,4-benzoquinol methylase
MPGALWFVEMRAEQLLLELRELLVRHDENLKAHTLMQECVPFFLHEDHPLIDQAREAQARMVAHITDGREAYRAYYSSNAHEQPFEEQYGIEASKAHEHLPRVALLRQALEEKRVLSADGQLPVLLDCSCNDGWMAANLRKMVAYHGIDLNPDCIERACDREVPRSRFVVGDLHDAVHLTEDLRPERGYDHVVCFEVLEHVADPAAAVAAALAVLKPGGFAYFSTPAGAIEHGDLPTWWLVEPKGHVRAFTPASFAELLAPHGGAQIAIGPDSVMVARVRKSDGSEPSETQEFEAVAQG